MKSSIFIILAFGVVACGTVRPVTGVDSTRVEIRTETRYVHDTSWVEIPVIVEKVAPLDTASVLENKYAKSEASVSGGILSHSLQTKPVREPVSVESKEIVRDSIVYRDRIQTRTVEVEKKLTGWQQAKMKVGGVCFILIILIGLYFIYSFISNLKP